MRRDDLLDALFPGGHALRADPLGVLDGEATTAAGTAVGVVGIEGGQPLGIEAALALASHVLDHAARDTATPLLLLVDTASQRMSRRDELLGLNEYLAHLSKSLALASLRGHRTVAVLHGGAAAGAFIATALSTDRLVALPDADPSVMDLPSIARVTKLPLERLTEMASSTPIFAPGLDALAATGAVTERWDGEVGAYAARLDALLSALRDTPIPPPDERAQLGRERGGRLRSEQVALRVLHAATGGE